MAGKTWNTAEAISLQKRLAVRVRQELLAKPIEVVAGADVAFSSNGKLCVAAVTAMRWPDMKLLETAQIVMPVEVPYIPGLLSFRETPAVVAAVDRVKLPCDVLLIDGQGLAHPRRFGLACHVGLELDCATIGCAKSRLIGEYRQPATRKGSRCRLIDKGEVVGMVVRTRQAVKCLFVSVGHRTQLDEAVNVVLRCCRGYRLAEPIRLAHQIVSKARLTLPMDNCH